MEYLKCIKCGVDKEICTDNFYCRKESSQWIKTCKTCIILNQKDYYKNNKENIKEKKSKYRDANRTKLRDKARVYNSNIDVKKMQKKWRTENKKLLREKEKEWIKNNPEKYKEILKRKSAVQRKKPSFKIKAHISRQVNFALHRQGESKKGDSVIKHLAYTIEELKLHLESLFEPWMTWSNYGKCSKNWDDSDTATWTWNIDHIIPQSILPYMSMEDENFKKCWSLENLRPLSSKINSLEGSNKIRHK